MNVTHAQRDHIENVTKLVNIRVRRQNNGVIHTRCAQCNYTPHFPSVSQPHSIFHNHIHTVNTMYYSTPYSTVLTHGGAPRLQRLHGPLLLVGPRGFSLIVTAYSMNISYLICIPQVYRNNGIPHTHIITTMRSIPVFSISNVTRVPQAHSVYFPVPEPGGNTPLIQLS